ncbi:MAG: argininosuccinate synthase domain-containing protein, partial [Planctomycetota bacterium]
MVLFHSPGSGSRSMSKKCVLAYSGGLDTSVILGWLQDEGYEVHAVYVDLGQPCEDRQAILDKARNCGAASSRIVD